MLAPKKGRPIVYFVLLAVVIGMMIALRHCDKNLPVAATGGAAMEVAIEYAPLSCYTYADTLGGFSYDLLRLISAHAGVKMKINPMVTLHTTLEELNTGKYRIVVAEFPVTKEDKNDYLFTDPIYLDREVLVQLKMRNGSVRVRSQLDLAHDTVYVVKGSPMMSRLQSLSREIGDTIYVKTENLYGPEQLFLRVASGEVQYAVVNERLAREMAQKYSNVDISTGISFTQFQAWILNRKDTALRDSINHWLREVKATPQYQALYRRYFK